MSATMCYNQTLPDSSRKLKAFRVGFFFTSCLFFCYLTMAWKTFFLLIRFKDWRCTMKHSKLTWIPLGSKEKRRSFFLSQFTIAKTGHNTTKVHPLQREQRENTRKGVLASTPFFKVLSRLPPQLSWALVPYLLWEVPVSSPALLCPLYLANPTPCRKCTLPHKLGQKKGGGKKNWVNISTRSCTFPLWHRSQP